MLAYCTTYFHLLNIIQLKLTLLANENVDLVLSADTNFVGLKEKLQKSNLFEKIVFSPIKNGVWSREYNEFPDKKKSERFLSLVQKGHNLPIRNDYSDFYFGLDDPYNKFLYYCLATRGTVPKVHLYDEGTASYVLSYTERVKNDKIPHKKFDEINFLSNLCELLVYAPDLCEFTMDIPINKIPTINKDDKKVQKIFNMIFEPSPLPPQKYIFFEGGAFQDWLPTLDIEILEQIAEIVGKNNILVKLHPRTQSDRFTRRGYTVMTQENVPWEVYALNESLENRVCLSNASTAALTLYTIFNMTVPCINLFKIDFLEKSLYTRQKNFLNVYNMQEKIFNKEKLLFFSPSNIDEVKKIISYLELSENEYN